MYGEDSQLTWFAPDTFCGKTCRAYSVPEPPAERISGSSSKRSAASKAIPFQSLDLTPGNGNLLGESYWEILSPSHGGCWTLNIGEYPSEENVSSLYAVLETTVPDKYFLSAKACWGILRRAQEKQKEIPQDLKIALLERIAEEWNKTQTGK